MSSRGESQEVSEGSSAGGASLGLVWDSGHFEGSGVQGKVRRTPAGWVVEVDRETRGRIDRDGVAEGVALRVDGATVVHGDEIVAHTADAAYAAGALALVWLGRPDLYGALAPKAAVPSPVPVPAVAAAVATPPPTRGLVVAGVVLGLVVVVGAVAVLAL